ncbi:MAG: 3-deoxy-manno-octulosonate cytidylyltransferase [Agarilytica sp.]
MRFNVIIPARYASQRLPGKPLKTIAGQTMIQRVYQAAKKSMAERVIVATDDQRIFEAVTSFGGDVVMTSAEHASGTDRLQEVCQSLGLGENEIIVNVQGDEPLIPAAVINQVADNLAKYTLASAATLSEAITDSATVFDSNAVKVVSDNDGYALYFSRAPIPWVREAFDEDQPVLPKNDLIQRHIGIYAYRVGLLNQFVIWPLSVLEANEKLEQLRILSNGKRIHVEQACELVPGGVDTPEDLQKVNALFSSAEPK